MALVIDEYGSIKGLLTTGDLLAAIAGELADTNDQPLVIPTDDGWLLDGSLPLDQLEELLHLSLEPGEGDYFTLGGLLLDQLQHIPIVGEEVLLDGYVLQISHMEGRRIHQVRAIKQQGRLPQEIQSSLF